MLSNLLVQLINGLADACALFLVASGLSLIFGVTRIVNFAHGSFYMLGVYVAYSLTSRFGATAAGFWLSMIAAALVVAVLGALVEVIVMRRIYQAPELFHLLATFALVLIFRDAALSSGDPRTCSARARRISAAPSNCSAIRCRPTTSHWSSSVPRARHAVASR